MKSNAPKWLRLILSTFGMWVSLWVLANAMATVIPDRDSGEDWIDALTNAVMIERRGGGGHPGVRFEPYIEQLQIVRAQFRRGDEAATYAAMNRLMDMLETRENGIPAATADWLFDFCYVVTPARYHDVSRHIDKFIKHQYGEMGG
ncbi:MAG: hypothetical protein C4534_10295 [Gaiellales bacterium]|nr:MAG: hypothetical protein C4534_10295 [Gaiellales bacterium]